jgi:glycosyltransferase involved in cell wall biosynthesis
MKTFVTLFPSALLNVHLIKDVGMVPLILHRQYDYDSKIVCYRKGEYPYLNTICNGLKMEFINPHIVNPIWWIISNAKDVDILNMYHFRIITFILLILYKMLNSKGKTYLKLDISREMFFNLKKPSLKVKLLIYLSRYVDYISVENTSFCEGLIRILGRRITYVPNGISEKLIKSNPGPVKKNILLMVGRVGAKPKNTELILEAFAICKESIPGWELYLVGPIEQNFHSYMDAYFSRYPHLKEYIFITGNIEDLERLNMLYASAKIFILPSRWESFGISIVEAMANGCYPILSDAISSAQDLTKEGEYGVLFESENTDDLCRKIKKSVLFIGDKKADYFNSMKKYIYDNFTWEKIIKRFQDNIHFEDQTK